MAEKQQALEAIDRERGALEALSDAIWDHPEVGYRETFAADALCAFLEQNGFQDIKEGTIYPLLVRLEKKGIIRSEFRPSPLGPSRKYYSLTPDGFEYLQEFTENWKQIEASVNQIFRLEE